MIDKELTEELPVLKSRDVVQQEGVECIEDELWLAVTDRRATSFRGFFHTETYVIQFLVCGTITGEFNHHQLKMEAPCGMYIMPGHVLRCVEASDDMRVFSLSYSESFRKDLYLNFASEHYHNVFIHPYMSITEEQLNLCLSHFSLLKELVSTPEIANTRELALYLVRSLICYVSGVYDNSFRSQYHFSRSEDITSRFLALVDTHCNEHHSIDWYAEVMCLSPKYISNVVKQVTGQSAGNCITERLVRHAKSMLLTSSLSIQQIADRLGFQNQSHFGTYFRRAVGMSPRKFRNQ